MSLATYKHSTGAVPGTEKQKNFIKDLADKRDWQGHVPPQVIDTVLRIKNKQDVSKAEASFAIDKLLGCKPLPTATQNPMVLAKNLLLGKLPISKYALPRKDGSGWDFFEVIERKNGARFLNQLLGSPSNWNRKMLPIELQLAAGQAISTDPKNSAVQYAVQHGRCAVCNAHLSDPKSIALSMGPVCAKRFS